MLKINRNNETGKSRILVRTEGIGRVVLNVALFKKIQMIIDEKNKKFIRFPVVEGVGHVVTYLIRVRSEEDAEKLVKALDEETAKM